MVTKRPSQKATHLPKDKLLPKVTMLFFDRPLATFLLWLALIVFGLASYTTLLKRAGFPSVNIPLNIVSGTYFVNDAAKVDHDVAQPLTEVALADSNVKSVQAQGADNFLTVQVQYKDGTDAQSAAKKLEQEVNDSHKLPANAHLQYFAPYFGATGGDTQQIDVAISFFDKNGTASTSDLAAKAQTAATWLQDKHLKDVKSIALKNPFETNADPETGQTATVQRTFDRFGQRDGTTNKFYNSVLIGIAAQKGTDVIKLDKRVRDALVELSSQPQFAGYDAQVSASFAPSIKDNLSELQRVLLEGLLAILVVGSIVIAIRASFITVVSMITVLLSALGFLYAIHYTLNVITLFALILGLALIVDDTIIMVEAIDSARKRSKNRREIVLQATRKISRAMLAATLTACLSFTPLLFVGGILGSFIRAIPITIIAALLISLLVALIFIPFFARFLLLGKKQLKKGVTEVSAGFEAALARSIAKPMEWARHSRAKLTSVIIIAICVGIGFVGAGGFIAKDVVFNIFPPTKDTNEVGLNLAFPPGTSIGQAETISANAEKLASQTLGDNFVRSSFNGTGDAQVANLQIEIISYSKRKVTSPQLVKQLQTAFDTQFKGAQVVAAQIDLGPPSSAFTVQIDASNREAAFKLANDMAAYLKGVELKRTSGKIAHMNNVSVSNPGSFLRTGHKAIITVSAGFDGDDTTTLVTLAQDAVKKEFPPDRVGSYGVPRDAISYDIGQESENQDSFKTLALAFPILLVVIFILLAIQFRSLLQPLLIFLAIPFSIFGVMLGLRLTNNAISFFTMLGFFALVGLSIKNTILLTDYANQARRQGMEPIDAAREALQERFRPLFATSMTAVVSLIPLALTSPFWQGLSVVLIFGLLSSTFLVVTVFPYYYLAAEYARLNIR
ncbi:MAG TPA: efflux RND transporter permease subunit, partial [Patescibacteria group bacterium]|nr:efflux RND transporter permease subunit [Patescibacteria group bacterium]